MWAHSCRGGPFHNRFRPFAKLQIVPGHVFATVHTGIHGMFRDTVQHGSFLEAQPEERAATTRWRQRWLAGQNLDYKRILAGKSHPLCLFFSCGELEKYDYRRKLTGFLSGGIISLLLFYRVAAAAVGVLGAYKSRGGMNFGSIYVLKILWDDEFYNGGFRGRDWSACESRSSDINFWRVEKLKITITNPLRCNVKAF